MRSRALSQSASFLVSVFQDPIQAFFWLEWEKQMWSLSGAKPFDEYILI
jgi:hypothetical protein